MSHVLRPHMNSKSAGTSPVPAVIAVVLMICVAQHSALALDPHRRLTQYVHRSWQQDNGLPQSTVQALAQTADGQLWIGTEDGLTSFDGTRFATFTKQTTPQLRDNDITAMVVDDRGTLWIGTAAGLCTYRDRRFGAATLPHVSDRGVSSLYHTEDGALWVGGMNGELHRYLHGAIRTWKLAAANTAVSGMAEAPDGALWVGTNDGLVRLEHDSATLVHDPLVTNTPVFCVLAVSGGEVWFGTTRGVIRWRAGSFTRDTADEPVLAMFVDRGQRRWLGTRHGIMRVDEHAPDDTFTASQGLSSDFIRCFFEDREGNVWIGTQTGGLDELSDGRLMTFGKPEGVGADTVWSVFRDRDGSIWVGTDGAGVAHLLNGRWSHLTKRDGLSENTVDAVIRDRHGDLWVGTYSHGIDRVQERRVTHFGPAHGIGGDVCAIYEDPAGTIWVGSTLGLYRFDGRRFIAYGTGAGLPGPWVMGIMTDRSGRLWVATNLGACVREGERFVSTVAGIALPRHTTFCTAQASDGSILLGMYTGLARIAGRSIRTFTTADGLPDNEVWQIIDDRLGGVWCASRRGVYRIKRSELATAADCIRPIVYGRSDGLRTTDFSAGVQPKIAGPDGGAIWFATARGLSRLDLNAPSELPLPPARLDALEIDGRAADPASMVDLPKGSMRLDLGFAIPAFTAPERLHFRYKLEGYDRDWVTAGPHRTAHYTRIPAGYYRFLLSVTRDEEDTRGTPFTLVTLHVPPPFLQSTQFYAICGLAVAALLAAAYALRMRAVRRQYAAVFADRARIARELHDTVAQSLAGAGWHIDAAERSMHDRRSAETAEALVDARAQIDRCRRDIRHSLFDLRPMGLSPEGLVSSLEALARDVSEQTGLNVRSVTNGIPRSLPPATELHLLRIAQEAVSNCIRHSRASTVEVVLSFDERHATLTVTDEGNDRPVRWRSGATRHGLIGMRERALEAGGRLRLILNAGTGSAVVVTVPYSHRLRGLARRVLGVIGSQDV